MPTTDDLQPLHIAVRGGVTGWLDLRKTGTWTAQDDTDVFTRVTLATGGDEVVCVFGHVEALDPKPVEYTRGAWSGQFVAYTASRVIVVNKGTVDSTATITAHGRKTLDSFSLTKAVPGRHGEGKLRFDALYSWGSVSYDAETSVDQTAAQEVEDFLPSLLDDLSL